MRIWGHDPDTPYVPREPIIYPKVKLFPPETSVPFSKNAEYITCAHCGAKAIRRRWDQRFCKPACCREHRNVQRRKEDEEFGRDRRA